jgi:Na+/proline symporter
MDLEQISEVFVDNLVLSIVVIYMVVMIAIGYFVQCKGANRSAKDYLIANRGVGPFMIGGTVFATNWCGGVLLGAAGTAYTGYVVSTIADPWATCLTLVLMTVFFCAILRKLKIASLSEMYRLRFGKRGGAVATAMCIPSMITWTAANIVALTTIFKLFLEFDPLICAIVAGLIVILYTYMGGMLAVVYTDNIQAVMIMLGLIILIPTGIAFVGGFDVLLATTPENYWNLLPNDGMGAIATGFTMDPLGIFTWIAGLSGMGFGYLASVELTQRVLCARDTKTARQGLIIGSGMYAIAGFFSMMIALIAIVMVSQGTTTPAGVPMEEVFAEDGNYVLLVLAERLFDPNVMGTIGIALMAIFIGSLLAAIMSTTSATIFAASAAISTLMLHGSLSKYATTSLQVLRLTRILVLVIGTFCVFFSFVIDSLYWMMIFSFTILFNCMFWTLVGGLFWKRCNASSAIASIITGFIGVIICVIAQSIYFGQIAIEPQNNLWIGIQTFVPLTLGGVAMLVTALLTQKSDSPVALCDTDGKLVKWGDLPLSADTIAVRRQIIEETNTQKEV